MSWGGYKASDWEKPFTQTQQISMPKTPHDQTLLKIAQKANKLNQQLKQIQQQNKKAEKLATQQENQMQEMQETNRKKRWEGNE
jgi:hypothetical protein